MTTARLFLASASPARRALLAAAGIDAEVVVSGVDESAVDDDRPDSLCQTLARLKAEAVAERLRTTGHAPTTANTQSGNGTGGARPIVLGCDSVLGFESRVLGKPRDQEDAVARWKAMRGRQGVLYTGHCLIDVREGRRVEGTGATVVHFADLSDDEIERYVATGEPLSVAGAFTIDGLGGSFIESIEGDHGNVIGLSLPLLRRMLPELGLRTVDLWRPATG